MTISPTFRCRHLLQKEYIEDPRADLLKSTPGSSWSELLGEPLLHGMKDLCKLV